MGVTGRVAILLAVGAAAAALYWLYSWYRRRPRPGPEWLDVDDLNLELMEGCCAFVVFTTPTCRPCKAVLRRIHDAVRDGASATPTEVRTVDATERRELALRYEVCTVPTTFLITASGHVVERWRDVPEPADLRSAMSRL